jgi:hypothetical protein
MGWIGECTGDVRGRPVGCGCVDGHGMVVCWEGHLCGMSFP